MPPALPRKSFAPPESDKEYTATEMGQTKFVWRQAQGSSVPPDWGAAKERVRERQT